MRLLTDISNNLKLTQSLKQSIKILQLSSDDLINEVNEVIIENPFLLYKDGNISSNNLDKHYSSSNTQDNDYIQNLPDQLDVRTYLTNQMNLIIDNPQEKIIAIYMIDALNTDGYLLQDIQNIANEIKCNIKTVTSVLKKLQTLSPTGIFARNLIECLTLQLEEKSLLSEDMILVLNNLELVARKKINDLKKITNLSSEQINACLKIIQTLSPKPMQNFSHEHIKFKIPDVILDIDEGKVIMTLNDNISPSLVIHEAYANIDLYRSEADKAFFRTKMREANDLINSIEYRGNTILKVAKAIVEEQYNFFTKGIMYLKPLNLSKIADILGMNESTISRATSNKYMQTPFGIFEMKYFFSSSISSNFTNVENISSHKVREFIKAIIDDEDKSSPLSDEAIADALKRLNVNIARRTIAKYRIMLNIPSSSERKGILINA